MKARRAPLVLVLVAALVVVGCGGPILANPPVVRPAPAATATPAPRPADPIPVVLPADDAPHDRLTEWWYYTGHLRDAEGGRWGFEYVIFRAERGAFPVSWASHLAVTDETGNRFLYAQRTEVGPQVDRTAAGAGFAIAGPDGGDTWQMVVDGGNDRLAASAGPGEVTGAVPGQPFGLDLRLAATRLPVLHDGDGWIDFGPAGGSYYYSRTRMHAEGTLAVGDRTLAVEGLAWFDHQWGDFIAVGGGGWDWFAINLDDGTDLTISLVRDADGTYPLVYGTLVEGDGTVRHLPRDRFEVAVLDTWTSPRTGAPYPSGWRIAIPGDDLVIELEPTVADQELDTRPTTGVVYWEGSQRVRATRGGVRIGGEAYVELTGYAAAGEPER